MRRLLTIALASVGLAAAANAQCPDGSPPPCRTQTVAAAAPRRVNPPLDDKTWIVVPFDNLAENKEIDWLRSASVNLLYLDMSRWKDIHVVDDERVADIMREVPEASNATKLSLNAGLAMARRAGAGRLVMGDLLKVGNRTAVTGKVFDVRTGQRIRSERVETAIADSVMSLFPKLAQKVLNLSAPSGEKLGSLGTTRVDAYQEYIAGVEALNKFDLKSARRHLDEAIKLDSSFALAHYKQSIVSGWDGDVDGKGTAHAEAAARLAATLPARERTLIAGQNLSRHGEWTQACEQYSSLVRSDSTDIEALNGLGECSFHDVGVHAVGGDTSKMTVRANLNRSIRAFRRVLELDPTYHLAYQHIIDANSADRPSANLCYKPDPAARCTFYTTFIVRSGDSLVLTPVALSDTAGLRRQAARYGEARSRRRNLMVAEAFARSWVQNAPNEPTAHWSLGHVLLLEGQAPEAANEFARASASDLPRQQQVQLISEHFEAVLKSWRTADAVRLYDSLRTLKVTFPVNSGQHVGLGNIIAIQAPIVGRMTEFDSLVSSGSQAAAIPPPIVAYQRGVIRGVMYGITDSLAFAERAFFDQIAATRGRAAATRSIAGTLSYGLLAPRAPWPALDTTVTDPKVAPAIALMLHDTTRLRGAARRLDSVVTAAAAVAGADSGYFFAAALAYLAIPDSAAALRMLRFGLDTAIMSTPLVLLQQNERTTAYYVPREMLLRADLAAAAGQKAEARLWYQRFVDLWSKASPELQPIVDRARKSLAGLGSS